MMENELEKYVSLEYIKCIMMGLNFNVNMLGNDIEYNEKIIRNLCGCFAGMFYVISEDMSMILYFQRENPYLTSLSIRHISFRLSIMNDEKLELNDKLMLISILDLIVVYMYINKNIFENNDEYVDIVLNEIKNNLNIYKEYFIDNKIYDIESFLGPMSSNGLIQEFIVIGDIVKDIYQKESKIKKYK